MNILKNIYRKLSKVSDLIQMVIEVIAGLLIALCSLDLFYQVLYRFIIVKFVAISSPFTEEFARYAMVWSAYLAIAICAKEGNMPALTLLPDAMKGKAKYVIYAITRIAIVAFLIYGIKYGWAAIMNNRNFHSPVMNLPGTAIYSSPFAACILLLFDLAVEVIGVVSGEAEPFSNRGNSLLFKWLGVDKDSQVEEI